MGLEDYADDNKCNEWTPEIPFENVSMIIRGIYENEKTVYLL